MSSDRTYIDYLEDILDAVQKVKQFIAGMDFEQFTQDAKTTFAVIRAFEVVGEATKQVPESVKVRYPETPWREMAGMRDKLIHDYSVINADVLWKTINEDVPELEPQITRIIAEEKNQE